MAVNTDPTMPQFVFPIDSTDQTGTNANLNFNFIDTVNVSWTSTNTDQFQTQLIFYISKDSTNQQISAQNNVSSSGFQLFSMNIAANYPADGHFNLIYIYPNGTTEGGPNSQGFTVQQNQSLKPVTWSAQGSSDSAPAAATTSKSSPVVQQTSSPTPTPSTVNSSPTSLGAGAIAGIVLGVIAILLGLASMSFFLIRWQRRRRQQPQQLHEQQRMLSDIDNKAATRSSIEKHNDSKQFPYSTNSSSAVELHGIKSPTELEDAHTAFAPIEMDATEEPHEMSTTTRWSAGSTFLFSGAKSRQV